MTCEKLKERFDEFVDGNLDEAEAAALRSHVADCGSCQRLFEREKALRSALKEYGDMTTPDTAFYDAALVRAAREGRRRQHKRSWLTGFGTAVAAGLAIWVVSSVWFVTPTTDTPAEQGMPLITMALEQPRTVNLVFSSASSLEDATLTVSLPEGVEVEGFAGRREITWRTSLREGKNLLPLKLVGTLPTDGVLLATLRHGDDDRTFRLRVNVT